MLVLISSNVNQVLSYLNSLTELFLKSRISVEEFIPIEIFGYMAGNL